MEDQWEVTPKQRSPSRPLRKLSWRRLRGLEKWYSWLRSLYDCPEIPVGPEGVLCRVVVATHPTSKKKSSVGVTRSGVVYELFFTTLPQQAFTAADVRSAGSASRGITRLRSPMRIGRSTPIVGAATMIRLFGVSEGLAASLGLAIA
jgi:hypothetical protein